MRDTFARQWFQGRDAMLHARWPSGEVDTIPWPLILPDRYWSTAKWCEALIRALCDARELGELPAQCEAVLLPDGQEVKF